MWHCQLAHFSASFQRARSALVLLPSSFRATLISSGCSRRHGVHTMEAKMPEFASILDAENLLSLGWQNTANEAVTNDIHQTIWWHFVLVRNRAVCVAAEMGYVCFTRKLAHVHETERHKTPVKVVRPEHRPFDNILDADFWPFRHLLANLFAWTQLRSAICLPVLCVFFGFCHFWIYFRDESLIFMATVCTQFCAIFPLTENPLKMNNFGQNLYSASDTNGEWTLIRLLYSNAEISINRSRRWFLLRTILN